MSVRPRKVTELPTANNFSSGDFFIVEVVGQNVNTTSKISGTNLRKKIFAGPYANDSVANTSGVLVGEPYYTPTGEVRIRVV